MNRGFMNFAFVIGMILIGVAVFIGIMGKISKTATQKIASNTIFYKAVMFVAYIAMGILALSWVHSCLFGGLDW